jgi:hypothetical protein
MQHAKEAVAVKHTASIFDRIEQLVRDSIARRAFEIFEGKGRWPGRELDDWLALNPSSFTPRT